MEKWKSTDRLTFQGALRHKVENSAQKYSSEKHSKPLISTRSKNRILKASFDEPKDTIHKAMSMDLETETNVPKKKQPLILMNKFHLSLASYIQDHKCDVKFSGTKRFCDKSGEYYLKNVLIEKNPEFAPTRILPKLSLKEPTNLINCIQKCNGLKPLTKKASEIHTKLPKNSLTPIPMMSKKSIKSSYEGKELLNAERTAVHIRRLEYSSEFKKHKHKPLTKRLSSIILIQQWWRTIYAIIRIQRYFRGWIFRKKLMVYLDNEEALIEKILLVEKTCNKMLMKRFIWKLNGETWPFTNRKETFEKEFDLSFYFKKWRCNNIMENPDGVQIASILKKYKITKKRQKLKNIEKGLEALKKAIVKPLFALLKTNMQLFAKEKEIARQKESLASTMQTINQNTIEQNALLKQRNNLKKCFDHWRELSCKHRMIKLASQRFRWNKNKDKVKEILNKWKRFTTLKANHAQIASYLIVLHHNKELSRILHENEYSNKLPCPIILDFPMRMKPKKDKDISCISEKDENEDSLENDTANFAYYKKKPGNSNKNENDLNNSGSDNDQLDKNANFIQYDETLAPKDHKKSIHHCTLSVSASCFEIQNVNSSENKNDKETQTNPLDIIAKDKELGAESGAEREIGVEDIDKEIDGDEVIEEEEDNCTGKRVKGKGNSDKEKETNLRDLINKKEFQTLKNNLNKYNSQAKVKKLADTAEFIEKVKQVVEKNLLSYAFRKLLKRDHLKQILLKESQKNDTNNLYRLIGAFSKWKLDTENNNLENSKFNSSMNSTNRRLRRNRYEMMNDSYSQMDLRLEISPSRTHLRFGSSYKKNHLNTEDISKENNHGRRRKDFDLEETKKETMKSTIYSSQSFFFQKEDNIDQSKVKLQSNFHSMFKLPTMDNKNISNLKNARIQVTKATIPYEDTNGNNEENNNDENSKKVQTVIMNTCQNDLQYPRGDANEGRGGYHFAFPIKDQPLMDIKLEEEKITDPLKKISLINNATSTILTKPSDCHIRRSSSSKSINFNPTDSVLRKNSFETGLNRNQTYQLKEMNHAQYYHGPVVQFESKDNLSGIYTKNINKGKSRTFYSKNTHQNNNKNLQLDLLENDGVNKGVDAKQSPSPMYMTNTFYEAFQPKPSSSYFLYNRQNPKGSKHTKAMSGNFFRTESSIIDSNTFSRSPILGNYYDTNTHKMYESSTYQPYDTNTYRLYDTNTQRFYDTMSPSLSYTFTDELNSNQDNNLNTIPKLIQSKKICFKPSPEKKNEKKEKSTSAKTQPINMKINWGMTNLLLFKQFYEKFHKRLLLDRLLGVAKDLNGHINLCYLLKLTLVHRSTAQVNDIKELLNNWKLSLRRYNKKPKISIKCLNSKNSLFLIEGNKKLE